MIEDRTKTSIDVNNIGARGSQVGDSGYLSHPSGLGHQTTVVNAPSILTSDATNSHMVEAHLMPHLIQEDTSMISEESSVWGDDREQHGMELSWNDLKVLEQLSQEVANRGSPKAEVQLRYLLQLLMEASCLEWSVVVAVLLRDAMAVFRAINAARSPDQSVAAVQRLRDGILALLQWANVQCLGYKPFIVTIQNQISVLNKILLMKEQQERQLSTTNESGGTPPGRRSRKSSSNLDSTNNSGNLSGINNDSTDKVSNPSKTCEDKSSKSGKSVGLASEEGTAKTKADVTDIIEVNESETEIQETSRCSIS